MEELFELFDSFLRNTDSLSGKELSEDVAQLRSLLSLEHMKEGLVEVIGELDVAFLGVREFGKDGEDTVDSFDSGFKLVVDDFLEVSVFSFSLDFEVVQDIVDGGNVVLSLSLVSFGTERAFSQLAKAT